MKINKKFLYILSAFLIIILFFPACFDDDTGTNQTFNLKGWADPADPVSGATVSILNTSGELLLEKENATTLNGTFSIEANNLPPDFRIVVTGGQQSGINFTGKLVGDFRYFDSIEDVANIDADTTAASDYLDKNPGATLEDAVFIVTENRMKEDESSPNDPVLGGSMGAWVAEKLAAGVLSYVAGQTFGSALDAIGLGSTPSNDLLNALINIQAQLIDLQSQLNTISRQISETEYNIIIGQLRDLTDVITSTYKQICFNAANPITNAEARAVEKQRLLDIIASQIMTKPNIIHDALIGAGQTHGLIVLQSQIITSKIRFFSKSDSAKQRALFDYYDQIQTVQLLLIAEYYNAQPNRTAYTKQISNAIDLFTKNRMDELALEPDPVPNGYNYEPILVVVPTKYDTSEHGIMIYISEYPDYRHKMDQIRQALPDYDEIEWYSGLSNWRLASIHAGRTYSDPSISYDIQAMFGNDAGLSPRNFAITKGWPINAFATEMHFLLYQDTQLGFSNWYSYHIDWEGKTSYWWDDVDNAEYNTLWVRNLEADEFYFYTLSTE